MQREFRHCASAMLIVVASSLSVWGEPLPASGGGAPKFSPPATPLVACDPYFSVWSTGRALADVDTTHWTGKPQRMVSLIRIDGQTYRLLGSLPAATPVMSQTGLEITPTRSIYRFEGAGLAVELTFTTPALPEDIDLLSRPITYVSYSLRSTDDRAHTAEIFFSAGGELTVDQPRELVNATTKQFGDVVALEVGSDDQSVLGRKGDDLRIDWGFLYLAAQPDEATAHAIGRPAQLQAEFIDGGSLGRTAASQGPTRADQVAIAVMFDAKPVGAAPVERWLVLAYDDLYSIEYMRRSPAALLAAERTRRGRTAARGGARLSGTGRTVQEVRSRVDGGPGTGGRAGVCAARALAYRQCFAAGKFVADANGQPLQFCKENHSNGCIGTSDVFYPMSPQFLLFGPSLAKVVRRAVHELCSKRSLEVSLRTARPGHLSEGERPGLRRRRSHRRESDAGRGERQSADLDGRDRQAGGECRLSPDSIGRSSTKWAEYLKQKGFDPENQLCTDDFAGHLAHNVNLSAKAICGLGAFAQLCEMRGEQQLAAEYRATSRRNLPRDGSRKRTTAITSGWRSTKPGTWSQKYNLVWDRVLGLNLFPDAVFRKEMDYYRKSQNQYRAAAR